MMADVEQEAIALKNESESAGMMVESFIRAFLGDPFGMASEIINAQGELQKKFKEAAQQVKLTFHRVEEIAVAHGARLQAK
jgi:phosphate uptake regulator